MAFDSDARLPEGLRPDRYPDVAVAPERVVEVFSLDDRWPKVLQEGEY